MKLTERSVGRQAYNKYPFRSGGDGNLDYSGNLARGSWVLEMRWLVVVYERDKGVNNNSKIWSLNN